MMLMSIGFQTVLKGADETLSSIAAVPVDYHPHSRLISVILFIHFPKAKRWIIIAF